MSGTTSYKEYVARSYQVMAEDGWDFDRESGYMIKEGNPPVPVAPEDHQSAVSGCHWAKVEKETEAATTLSYIPALGTAWLLVGMERVFVHNELEKVDDQDSDGWLRWRVRMLVRAARHAAQMQLKANQDLKELMQTIASYERWHYGPGQHGPTSHTR